MKHNNKVGVSNLIVESLSKKKNEYNAEICCMKVVDTEVKNNETNYCLG
jgi:hypothetical protein